MVLESKNTGLRSDGGVSKLLTDPSRWADVFFSIDAGIGKGGA